MRVLYVDHTSLVSGAQRCLLDLVGHLPASVEPVVMCPPGRLAELSRALGVEVVDFPGTAASLRLHPLHTARASADMIRGARRVRDVARHMGAQVVHANSIRAGLIAGQARLAGGPPTVVHVHDALPSNRAARGVRSSICRSADALITISDYTTRNFVGEMDTPDVHMLHNPLDVGRFDPSRFSREQARAGLAGPGEELIGLAAQITPWKGQATAIRALSEIRERHRGARLLLIGETKFVDRATRYDNVAYERWLRRLIRALGLEGHVTWCGEREDVEAVVRALDVLVAPSWEEPFGRSVIEAMALETAVVATNVGGPAEVIDHGVDGLLADPHDVGAWASGVETLLADSARREAMGRRAREKVATRFHADGYASRVVDVYDEIFTRPSRSGIRRHRVDGRCDVGQPKVP